MFKNSNRPYRQLFIVIFFLFIPLFPQILPARVPLFENHPVHQRPLPPIQIPDISTLSFEGNIKIINKLVSLDSRAQRHLDFLAANLQSDQPKIIILSLWALGEMAEAARPLVPKILQLLSGENVPHDLLEAALLALGKIGYQDEKIFIVLQGYLKFPTWFIREKALIAITAYDSGDYHKIIALLGISLGDKNPFVRIAALDSMALVLQRLRSDKGHVSVKLQTQLLNNISKAQEDSEKSVRLKAINVIAGAPITKKNKAPFYFHSLTDEDAAISQRGEIFFNGFLGSFFPRVKSIREKSWQVVYLNSEMARILDQNKLRTANERVFALKVIGTLPWLIYLPQIEKKIKAFTFAGLSEPDWQVRLFAAWAVLRMAQYRPGTLPGLEPVSISSLRSWLLDQVMPVLINKLTTLDDFNRLEMLSQLDAGLMVNKRIVEIISQILQTGDTNEKIRALKKIALLPEVAEESLRGEIFQDLARLLDSSDSLISYHAFLALAALLNKSADAAQFTIEMQKFFALKALSLFKTTFVPGQGLVEKEQRALNIEIIKTWHIFSLLGINPVSIIQKKILERKELALEAIFPLLEGLVLLKVNRESKNLRIEAARLIFISVKNPNPQIRNRAMQSLLRVGSQRTDYVSPFLPDLFDIIRLNLSADETQQHDTKEAGDKLPDLGKNFELAVFAMQISAEMAGTMGHENKKNFLALLKNALKDPEPQLRASALKALSEIPSLGKEFFPLLKELFIQENFSRRSEILRAVSRMENPGEEEMKLLRAALDYVTQKETRKIEKFPAGASSSKVAFAAEQIQAVLSLGRMGAWGKQQLPLLVKIFFQAGKVTPNSEDNGLKISILESLFYLSQSMTVEELEKSAVPDVIYHGLSLAVSEVQFFASLLAARLAESKKITSPRAGRFFTIGLKNIFSQEPSVRIISARLLGKLQMDEPYAHHILLEALVKFPEPKLRLEIFQTLKQMPQTLAKVIEKLYLSLQMQEGNLAQNPDLLYQLFALGQNMADPRIFEFLEYALFSQNTRDTLLALKFLEANLLTKKLNKNIQLEKLEVIFSYLSILRYSEIKSVRLKALHLLSRFFAYDGFMALPGNRLRLSEIFFNYFQYTNCTGKFGLLKKIIGEGVSAPDEFLRWAGEKSSTDTARAGLYSRLWALNSANFTYVYPKIEKLFLSGEWLDRYCIINILGMKKNHQSLVLKYLKKDDALVRRMMVRSLADLIVSQNAQSPQVLDWLGTFDDEEDPMQQDAILDIILLQRKLPVYQKINYLISSLDSPSLEVRARAEGEFGKLGPPGMEVLPYVINHLDSSQEKVRSSAIWSMGEFGPLVKIADKNWFSKIERMSQERSPDVRREILLALGKILPDGIQGMDAAERLLEYIRQMPDKKSVEKELVALLSQLARTDKKIAQLIFQWLREQVDFDKKNIAFQVFCQMQENEETLVVKILHWLSQDKMNLPLIKKYYSRIQRVSPLLLKRNIPLLNQGLLAALNHKNFFIRVETLKFIEIMQKKMAMFINPFIIYISMADGHWLVRYWSLLALAGAELDSQKTKIILEWALHDSNENVRFLSQGLLLKAYKNNFIQ